MLGKDGLHGSTQHQPRQDGVPQRTAVLRRREVFGQIVVVVLVRYEPHGCTKPSANVRKIDMVSFVGRLPELELLPEEPADYEIMVHDPHGLAETAEEASARMTLQAFDGLIQVVSESLWIEMPYR